MDYTEYKQNILQYQSDISDFRTAVNKKFIEFIGELSDGATMIDINSDGSIFRLPYSHYPADKIIYNNGGVSVHIDNCAATLTLDKLAVDDIIALFDKIYQK